MGRRGLDYSSVLEMTSRQASRIVQLDAAGFVILLDLLHELSIRSAWHDDGDDLTDSQWDTAENWVAVCATALMTIIECEGEEPPEDVMVSFAIIRDEKANDTHGGSSTAATWVQRDLNTIVSDIDSIVSSLSSNAFVLIEGVFRIRALCPAAGVNDSRIRLWNVTQTALVREGQNARNTSEVQAVLDHIFTSNGSDSYRVDHRCDNSIANSGLGIKMTIGSNEVYSSVLLEKISD